MYKYKLYCIWFYFNQRNTFSKVNKILLKKIKKEKNFIITYSIALFFFYTHLIHFYIRQKT